MRRNIQIFISNHPLVIIMILAAIIRGIFLLFYYNDPQWDQLLVDSLFHNHWAKSIADGNIIGQDAFFRAPLYIYLLGGIYFIFGSSILAARIFGIIVGICSVYITGKIGYKLFGKKSAVIAALIHAFYPIAIYFESELLVDSLFTLLFELSILSFLFALENKKKKWTIVTGLLIGMAAITKPIILALVPLYIIWLFLHNRLLSKSIFQSILLIGSMLIIILPVTVRNLLVADDLVLISSSGGINFYIGNNASADGSTAAMPPPLGHNWQIRDINYIAEHESGRELMPSEISDFWYHKGLSWAIENKADFAKLYFHKLRLCLNNLEISNNRDLPAFFNSNPVLKILPLNFALILALAAIALFFILIKRQMNLNIFFLLIIVLSYILIISLFFINARYRLPVIPFLILFASFGLTNLFIITKQKLNMKYHILAAAIGLTIYLLSYIPVTAKTFSNDVSGGIFNKANYYLYKGDYKKASKLFAQLLDADFPDANLNLGVAYLRQGNGDSAAYYFRREIELYPNRPDGYVNIASLYLIKNQHLLSINYADSALAIKPYHTEAYIIKMRDQAALYDTIGLQNTISSALLSVPEKSRIYLEAGLIYSNWQMYDLAINHLLAALSEKIIAAETDDRAFTYSGATGNQISFNTRGRAAYQLGFIYGIRNDLDNSIGMSNLAISYDSSLADAYVNLINGYRLTGKIDSARYVSNLALHKFPNNQNIMTISSMLK